MNFAHQQIAPEYVDGVFVLYDIVSEASEDSPDFGEKRIRRRPIGPIPYRELSVYDRTRLYFEQMHREVQMKLAIPKWDGITSECAVEICGKLYKVYSAVSVISKQGYQETELTLTNPEMQYKPVKEEET